MAIKYDKTKHCRTWGKTNPVKNWLLEVYQIRKKLHLLQEKHCQTCGKKETLPLTTKVVWTLRSIEILKVNNIIYQTEVWTMWKNNFRKVLRKHVKSSRHNKNIKTKQRKQWRRQQRLFKPAKEEILMLFVNEGRLKQMQLMKKQTTKRTNCLKKIETDPFLPLEWPPKTVLVFFFGRYNFYSTI